MPLIWNLLLRRSNAKWILLGGLAWAALPVGAQSEGQKCPLALKHVQVSYSHVGGKSLPQLTIDFANRAGKDVARATFRLSLLNANGGSDPYPNDFEFEEGLGPGKRKYFAWDLEAGSVDIHRTGETVVLARVGYADGGEWTDDGSESCKLTVDFGAR